jgi:hypothetical protein
MCTPGRTYPARPSSAAPERWPFELHTAAGCGACHEGLTKSWPPGLSATPPRRLALNQEHLPGGEERSMPDEVRSLDVGRHPVSHWRRCYPTHAVDSRRARGLAGGDPLASRRYVRRDGDDVIDGSPEVFGDFQAGIDAAADELGGKPPSPTRRSRTRDLALPGRACSRRFGGNPGFRAHWGRRVMAVLGAPVAVMCCPSWRL